MGFLRFFLALCVVDTHYGFTQGNILINGLPAVICFFMISGFYMALVIHEKYGTSALGIKTFYLNRVLRLYPTYLCVLLLYIIFGALHFYGLNLAFAFQEHIPFLQRLGLIANQVLLFPQAIWGQVTLQAGNPNLVFGQMYTVVLEMLFYLLVPLMAMLTTPRLIIVTLATSLINVYFFAADFPLRPWQYDFFPGVLVFFLTGVLAYRGYRYLKTLDYPVRWGWLSLPCIMLFGLWTRQSYHRAFEDPYMYVLYALVAVSIPFLFAASKNLRLDDRIGNLSYPMYVIHWWWGIVIRNNTFGLHTSAQNIVVLFATLISSVLLVYGVERPLTQLRHRIAARSQAKKEIPGVVHPMVQEAVGS